MGLISTSEPSSSACARSSICEKTILLPIPSTNEHHSSTSRHRSPAASPAAWRSDPHAHEGDPFPWDRAFAGFVPFETVADIMVMGTLVAFTFVCLGAIRMKIVCAPSGHVWPFCD